LRTKRVQIGNLPKVPVQTIRHKILEEPCKFLDVPCHRDQIELLQLILGGLTHGHIRGSANPFPHDTVEPRRPGFTQTGDENSPFPLQINIHLHGPEKDWPKDFLHIVLRIPMNV
jgi:hypothetical protein